jgi:thiamine-monophosphate kinase
VIVKKPPGEFALIARLCAKLPRRAGTVLGPGDDCAILAPSRKPQLITIDSMVESVHFKLEWITPRMLGARALTVNLSDIAAMGGAPTSCVVNLAIRPGLDAAFFDRLYAGMAAAATAAGVDIVGGNITRASELAITIALLGDAGAGIMRRDSARPGDAIYVTGTIGDAAAGLRILNGQLDARGAARKFLVERFLNPTARIEAGRRLARLRPVPAAIDVSDGLWQDLGHILERSGGGAELDPAAVPLSPAYRAAVGEDPELALTGGDDYELLFCMRPRLSDAALTDRLGVAVHRIGTIVSGKGAALSGRNRREAARLSGWDQLRRG